ncbi:MAG: M48 family metallopeptidase, partial [Desulfatiglandales bacterium]|nr:M48 family metallopeptidase [Desulfatiglandales bacterium]
IDIINVKYLKKHGKNVPDVFQEVIDGEKLQKITEYTLDNTQFSVVRTIIGKIVFLLIILSGLLPWSAEILRDLNYMPAGLIFFAIPGLLGSLVDLPFDYYHIFVIEERYAFNTRTLKIWLLDLLKALLVTLILGTLLLSLLLLMVQHAGNGWWIWAWLIFFSFQLLMLVLYPTLIAPFFNKFTPLDNSDLSEKIGLLAEKEGFTIKGVFKMDAAKRSRHTNAYFSGLGKIKRIVLFDTLMESLEENEILAVLSHEIGHLKKNHIKKQLVMVGAVSLVLFYLASEMIVWEMMYKGFGFSLMPAYAGLLLVAVLWEPVGFFLSPIAMAVSRRFEREADCHVFMALRTTEPLRSALKKMARDNLSNLRPHPLYAWFNYSHPSLLERVKRLEKMV